MRFKYKQTLTELSRYRVGDIFIDEYAKNTTGFAILSFLVRAGYILRGSGKHLILMKPINTSMTYRDLKIEALIGVPESEKMDFWINSNVEGIDKIMPPFYACCKFIKNSKDKFRVKDVADKYNNSTYQAIRLMLSMLYEVEVIDRDGMCYVKSTKPVPKWLDSRFSLIKRVRNSEPRHETNFRKNDFLYERARKAGLIK